MNTNLKNDQNFPLIWIEPKEMLDLAMHKLDLAMHSFVIVIFGNFLLWLQITI